VKSTGREGEPVLMVLIRGAQSRKQKTRRGGRVFVDADETRATAYPARKMDSGRRAREVMPAAMRALDWFACGKAALFIRAER